MTVLEDKLTDYQTGQKLYALDLSMQEHKNFHIEQDRSHSFLTLSLLLTTQKVESVDQD